MKLSFFQVLVKGKHPNLLLMRKRERRYLWKRPSTVIRLQYLKFRLLEISWCLYSRYKTEFIHEILFWLEIYFLCRRKVWPGSNTQGRTSDLRVNVAVCVRADHSRQLSSQSACFRSSRRVVCFPPMFYPPFEV